MTTLLPTGIATARDYADPYANLNFVIQQLTGQMATVELVKVLAVNASGLAPVGFLDCQPLVQQMDGAGNAVDHAVLHNLPYFRLQGGQNAVIVDPAVGDIGAALFCARDNSRVKTTRGTALPGSRRRFDWADGLYLGGYLNAAPVNYIWFDSNGDIRLKPAGTVYVQGAINVSGDVVAGGISLTGHHHGGVQTGSGVTGGPQ